MFMELFLEELNLSFKLTVLRNVQRLQECTVEGEGFYVCSLLYLMYLLGSFLRSE